MRIYAPEEIRHLKIRTTYWSYQMEGTTMKMK
jgi:hypothetical protein